MSNRQHGRRVWFFWLISGFALINVALFLHPMSPEDFLRLAFSDPLQSIFDAQGGGMAIFFWVSTALALAGLLGFLASSQTANRLLHNHKHGLRPLTN